MTGLSEETLASFNKLVYEYLLKMKFDKSALAFKMEANLGEIRLNDTLPSLLNWYNIFLETADVRSGKLFIPESLNRIEGIMLKLENEKQRYIKMSAISPRNRRIPDMQQGGRGGHYTPGAEKYASEEGIKDNYGMYDSGMGHDGGHMMPSPSDCDRGYPYRYEDSRPPAMAPPKNMYGQMKETNRIELNMPFIIVARHCPIAQIIISCCVDGKAYFFNLLKNSVELVYTLPKRHIKHLRIVETHDSVFLIYAFDDMALHLCRYINGRNEDLKVIESDVAIRSFCFGKNTIFVLTETSILRIYSFMGDLLKTFKISSAVFAVEFFSKCLLLIEAGRVVEFDVNINMEIRTLGRGKHPVVAIKDDFAFLMFSDSVRVFNSKMLIPIVTIKCALGVRDIDFVAGKVALCTGDEVYCGVDVFPVPNSLLISNMPAKGSEGCIVLTADGWLIFYSVDPMNEYI